MDSGANVGLGLLRFCICLSITTAGFVFKQNKLTVLQKMNGNANFTILFKFETA